MAGVSALAVVALPAGAGTGNSGPKCNGLTPTIKGSHVGEWITGTEGDDVIRAGAGDDTINGLGGNDVVCAGPGDDTTRGGPGNDTVRSGRGNDSSSGEGGDDDMVGQGDGDIAEGGAGVDRCRFESHEQCEADLDIDVTGPANATKGGPGVSVYTATLVNHGPTPAVNTRIDFTLPAGAVFVADSSDPRCNARSATEIRCIFGSMGLEIPGQTLIGLNFTGCQNPVAVDIVGAAEDPRTNDPVEPNTTDTQSTSLTIDPSCQTAVDDAATVGHDSGANDIDVLANDIGPSLSVASATNGAHGTVAVAGGGSKVTYTPDALYCGPDTFTYQLPSGSQATVTVTVLCPTAVDDVVDEYFCGQGEITIDVLMNDVNPGGAPFSISSVTQGTYGTVTISPDNQSVKYDQLSFPGLNSYDDTFTYTISPGGSTATVTVHSFCEGSD